MKKSHVGSWQHAERLAAVAMRLLGYTDVGLTGKGSDAGVDVKARGAMAQVKFSRTATGRPAIQQLVGARGHNHHSELLFFALTGYSKHARAYADQMGVALFTYRRDGTVCPANPTAQHVVDRRPQPTEQPQTTPVGRALQVPRAKVFALISGILFALCAVFAWSLILGAFKPINYTIGAIPGLVMLLVLMLSTFLVGRWSLRRRGEVLREAATPNDIQVAGLENNPNRV